MYVYMYVYMCIYIYIYIYIYILFARFCQWHHCNVLCRLLSPGHVIHDCVHYEFHFQHATTRTPNLTNRFALYGKVKIKKISFDKLHCLTTVDQRQEKCNSPLQKLSLLSVYHYL